MGNSAKILHTADLHFGKKLHGFDLSDQMELFINWLCDLVKSEEITHVLVAGDVFDMANPSAESMHLYYKMLKRLSDLSCGVIITAGNHDSAALLNAPAALLKAFDISIVGSAPLNPEDCLIPIELNGELKCIIAAVPYLRDSDIRRSVSGETYHDKLKAVREGIKSYYDKVAEACINNYHGIPVIAAGHLYAAGCESSDSEREIQIGNLAGVDAGTFNEAFRYVALGHIHKPQEVGRSGRIFYSGSPYPLSFSERSQNKFVRKIHVENGELKSDQIAVPAFREMVRFTGTLQEVTQRINAFKKDSGLCAIAELEIQEETFDTAVMSRKEELIEAVNQGNDLKIIFSRVQFLNQPVVETDRSSDDKEITPSSIFSELITDQEEDKRLELLAAFHELTSSVTEGGEA